MKPAFVIGSDSARIFHGDCLDVLRALPDESVDAMVTDPPSGIAFMGKDWDTDKGGRDQWIAWLAGIMREALRVLKPGAHALVWALPRTSHWTATAVEDAGFDVRDVIMHVFGTGFPKSLDVSKAINAHLGAATDDARRWHGWGTALKPAAEHWILARKPLGSTVAACVLEHGTGGINVDACRVGTDGGGGNGLGSHFDALGNTRPNHTHGDDRTGTIGRWPPHLLLTHAADCGDRCVRGCPVRMLDEQSGEGDSGGASRFFPRFRYTAKPATAEKNAGLESLPVLSGGEATGRKDGSAGTQNPRAGAGRNGNTRNPHPTVKPIELMRWLVRLITPPGGVVLDPFTGSGTTGVAALAEGARFIGAEMDENFVAVAAERMQHWYTHGAKPAKRHAKLASKLKRRKI